jgi:glyoxalase family protein
MGWIIGWKDWIGLGFPINNLRSVFEVFIYLEDYDGLGLELVFNTKDPRKGYSKELFLQTMQ